MRKSWKLFLRFHRVFCFNPLKAHIFKPVKTRPIVLGYYKFGKLSLLKFQINNFHGIN